MMSRRYALFFIRSKGKSSKSHLCLQDKTFEFLPLTYLCIWIAALLCNSRYFKTTYKAYIKLCAAYFYSLSSEVIVCVTSLIALLISELASPIPLANFWTSTATTAKPLPASPTRAASIEALSARIF